MNAYKITAKTTKDEAARLIGANINTMPDTDKGLVDRVVYTMSHLGEATRKDVISVLKDVMKATGEKFVVPAAADGNDTKKGAAPQTESKKPEAKKTESTENKAEPPKSENLVKSSKKGAPKAEKTEKKTEGDTEKKSKDTKSKKDTSVSERPRVLASVFPDTIKLGEDTFTIDHGVKTIKDLADKKKEFEFAFFWEKRHLKQFKYRWHEAKNPDAFPNNLDTAQLFYVSEKGVVAYCVSDYTEAAYTVYADDLEELDGIRFCNGVEFQIYSRPAEPETTTA